MKLFSSQVHGYIDYSLGLLLVLAPYLLNFNDIDVARNVAQGIGVLILGQSLFTNYELGLFKVIPLKVHLMLDVLASLFLAASPFLLGFNDYPANVWMPHLIVGIGYLLISLTTTNEVVESGKPEERAAIHA